MALKTDVKDRVPLYPGRVKMTPVSGQANTYDMVRADQPTQEGTPINKALFDKKADALTADATVYVTKSGNDTTGDGTSAKPYLTIQAALNSVPKNLGGYLANIHIGAGTYAGAVNIEYFTNGRVNLTGNAGAAVTIQGIVTIRSAVANIENIALTISNNYIYVTECGWLNLASPATLTCSGADHAVYARFGSHVCLGNNVVANNTKSSAFRCGENSTMYLFETSGSGNTVGMNAQAGTIWYRVNNMTATTDYATAYGGRIFSGAQTLLPKY